MALLVALPAVAAERPAGVKLPPYEKTTLKNGLTLILVEKHDVPLIAFHGRIRGGEVADAAGKEGASNIVAELLQKGAGSRDALAFSQAVDSAGGHLNANAAREAITVSGEFMKRDRALMLELLADMLTQPKLSKDEFEKVQQRSVEQIAAAKDNSPSSLIGAYFDALLFNRHPYGRSGDETSITGLSHADVKAYYKNHLGADRAILAFVGDFDVKTMKADIEKLLGKWKKAAGDPPKIEKVAPLEGRRVLLVDKPDATQTFFRIGNVGVARDDPDRVALDLANTAFGGRFTSMLNTELRIKSGLTYGARSRLGMYSKPGTVEITSYTKTESTQEALDLAIDVLKELKSSGLSDETLDSVQTYVAGLFPLDLETSNQLASRLTEIEFYGLGRSDVDDYGKQVMAANGERVKTVIDRVYPGPDNLTFVLIGKAETIRDVAKQYGDVTEMKITDPTFRPPTK
jgi:predicted Zn-dependent peptidase